MTKKDKKILILEDILALITLVSLVIIAMETVPDAREFLPLFKTIEYIVVGIFTFEYIVRIITAKNPFKYIFSFYGVVDLVSILPTLIGIGGFVFLKSLRIIRISRLFRMLRVFKFSEVANDIETREKKESEIDFLFYIKSLITLTVIFGGLVHIFEFHNNPLATLPESFLWAFKLLVGITPLVETYTVAGEAIKIATMFSGFMLLAVMIYLVRTFVIDRFFSKN
ncbi:MAG: voltage-gated potassium channel [Patescibacteria group bacterium]|nr:voltage-gated potassium channel [Patescibacteria group bacterium]